MSGSEIVTWAVELRGSSRDLTRLKVSFRDGDPKVTEDDMDGNGRRLYLRSSQFDGLQNGRAAEPVVRSLLRLINGAMKMHHESGEVTFGALRSIHCNGQRGTVLILEPAKLTLTGGTVDVLVSGRPLPGPTAEQKLVAAAASDSHVAEALKFLALGTDWINLWKAFEKIEESCPDRRRFIWSDGRRWATKGDVNRFAQTAQHHRHANEPLPDNPMTLDEARAWLFRLVQEWASYRWQIRPE